MKSKMKVFLKCSLIFGMRCIVLPQQGWVSLSLRLNPKGFMALWGSKADVCCLPTSRCFWLSVCFLTIVVLHLVLTISFFLTTWSAAVIKWHKSSLRNRLNTDR